MAVLVPSLMSSIFFRFRTICEGHSDNFIISLRNPICIDRRESIFGRLFYTLPHRLNRYFDLDFQSFNIHAIIPCSEKRNYIASICD